MSEDAKHIAAWLLAFTQSDAAAIRKANDALEPLLKDSRSILALVEILKAHDKQSVEVRQVAAIVLSKRLAGRYSKLDTTTQGQLKAEILAILTNEPQRTVRKGAVWVAGALFKIQPEWPELWQFIQAASQYLHPDARVLAFQLLEEMTNTVGKHSKVYFKDLSVLFQKGLEENDTKVRTAAVKALGKLMAFLADKPEIIVFSHHVHPLRQVASSFAQHDDEDTLAVVLDLFNELSLSPSPSLAEYNEETINFSLHVMTSSLGMGVRDSAARVVATLAEAKPQIFGENEAILARVLDTLFGLIKNSSSSAAGALFESNPAWRFDDKYDDEFDSPTETSMAQAIMDRLACNVQNKYIFDPIWARCKQFVLSSNAGERKAGIAGLGIIAEGCAAPLLEHLADVVKIVIAMVDDQDALVREWACFTLGRLSQHCQPLIFQHSSEILTFACNLLHAPELTVQISSCAVLDILCQRLEPEAVLPKLDTLVKRLVAMLTATKKRSVQEMVIAALAATAVAAEDEFGPYVAGVACLMTRLMLLTDEKMYSLRGRALECMGHMAIAVGKEAFQPYFLATMKCAKEGFCFDSADLREIAYAVFANLAEVMGEQFASELTPHFVHDNLHDIIRYDEEEWAAIEKMSQGNLFNALDDSDDDEEDLVIDMETPRLEARKGAITALGKMARHTGISFCPFLEESMQVLQKAANESHPLIKRAVAEALPSLVAPNIAAYHKGKIPWTKGHPNNPGNVASFLFASAVLKDLITLMEDDDKETVGKACEGIQSVIEQYGPQAFVQVADDCLRKTLELLCKDAPCNRSDLRNDHHPFMTSVCDLVGSFARVMGDHTTFKHYLPEILAAISKHALSSRLPSDRSMAVGCLCEIAQETDIFNYWEAIYFPAILAVQAGLDDPADDVKRNGAFCAGMCCESLGEQVANKYPQLLHAVGLLFSIDPSTSESSAAAVDNAAAAVSRMIMACPNHVPMSQVLGDLLKVLPLRSDMTENETIYKCLFGLQSMNQSDFVANKDKVRRVYTTATSHGSTVDEKLQVQIRLALQAL